MRFRANSLVAKGADCKSAALIRFEGASPSLPTMRNRPHKKVDPFTLTRGMKSPQMHYALYVNGFCHENMCGRLKSARVMKSCIQNTIPNSEVVIVRYDRSGYSNYEEVIL